MLGEHRVTFGAGYGIEDTSNDDALLGEAVALAGEADVVVCVLGLPASYESEGYDRTHIELPANQSRLLTAVIGANANVVVVLVNGSVGAASPTGPTACRRSSSAGSAARPRAGRSRRC